MGNLKQKNIFNFNPTETIKEAFLRNFLKYVSSPEGLRVKLEAQGWKPTTKFTTLPTGTGRMTSVKEETWTSPDGKTTVIGPNALEQAILYSQEHPIDDASETLPNNLMAGGAGLWRGIGNGGLLLVLKWMPKLSFLSASTAGKGLGATASNSALWGDVAFATVTSVPTIMDINENGFNPVNSTELGLSMLPVAGLFPKMWKNFRNRWTPYGFQIGNNAYGFNRETAGMFDLFRKKKLVPETLSKEDLTILKELQAKYPKLPTTKEVSNGIEQYATRKFTENGREWYGFGRYKGDENGVGSMDTQMNVGTIDPETWPLTEFGIDPPVFVETHQVPIDHITVPRGAMIASAKAQSATPRGTLFGPDPYVGADKELIQQSIVHSNLSDEKKIELLKQFKNYNPLDKIEYEELISGIQIPFSSTEGIVLDGLRSLGSEAYHLGMSNKSRFRPVLHGVQSSFNNHTLEIPNLMKDIIAPRFGKRNPTKILDFLPTSNLEKLQEFGLNYPNLDWSKGWPAYYIQMRKFGGKLNGYLKKK